MSRGVGIAWVGLMASLFVMGGVAACQESREPVSDEREIDIDIYIPKPAPTKTVTIRPLAPKPATSTPTRKPRADEVNPPVKQASVTSTSVDAAAPCPKCAPPDKPTSGVWTPPPSTSTPEGPAQ